MLQKPSTDEKDKEPCQKYGIRDIILYGHPFIHIDRVFSSLFLKKPIVIHSSTDTDRTENNTIQF